jgi:hypothetical protein
VRLTNNVGSKLFLKFFQNSIGHIPQQSKIQTRVDVEKYLALVGMCMSLRNLSIFIQLRSISKSRFNKINTNSDIAPPNHLDMVTFEILLA